MSDDIIKIALHPATCPDEAQRIGHVDISARRFAACLGQELTPQQRPPQVCYDLAVLLAYQVIDPGTGDDLLTAARRLRERQPQQCVWCWLKEQLAIQAAAYPRRYAHHAAAAAYGRPNI